MGSRASGEQPGRGFAPTGFVGADGVRMLQAQTDLVEPANQAILAERVDLEREFQASWRRHCLSK